MADFSILLICKFRQYKVVNIANFVYYGKTQMDLTSVITYGISQDEVQITFDLSVIFQDRHFGAFPMDFFELIFRRTQKF